MFKDVDDKLLVIAAVWSLLVIAMVVWMIMGAFPSALEKLLTFGLGGLFGMAVGKVINGVTRQDGTSGQSDPLGHITTVQNTATDED